MNADELARTLPEIGRSQREREIAAARLMLRQIDALSAAGEDFVFETTLSSLGYARKLPEWRARGYYVSLVYLRLENVEASIARVARRVADGGHDIPEEIIRRRFGRSKTCLIHYKNLVNEWYLYDSLQGEFSLADSGKNE